MKVYRYNIGGLVVVAGRRGQVVILEDPDARRRARMKARSVHEARQIFDALTDLAIKARQFELRFDIDEVARRVARMVEGARWFANRKRRTYAS